jgi:hypothetical protein
MHDALQAILGLDVLIDAEWVLGDSRRAAEATAKLTAAELRGWHSAVGRLDEFLQRQG